MEWNKGGRVLQEEVLTPYAGWKKRLWLLPSGSRQAEAAVCSLFAAGSAQVQLPPNKQASESMIGCVSWVSMILLAKRITVSALTTLNSVLRAAEGSGISPCSSSQQGTRSILGKTDRAVNCHYCKEPACFLFSIFFWNKFKFSSGILHWRPLKNREGDWKRESPSLKAR